MNKTYIQRFWFETNTPWSDSCSFGYNTCDQCDFLLNESILVTKHLDIHYVQYKVGNVIQDKVERDGQAFHMSLFSWFSLFFEIVFILSLLFLFWGRTIRFSFKFFFKLSLNRQENGIHKILFQSYVNHALLSLLMFTVSRRELNFIRSDRFWSRTDKSDVKHSTCNLRRWR
jgi:hypothetical protein